MVKLVGIIVLAALVFSLPIQLDPVASQSDDCETLVAEAIRIVGTSCASLGRNEACYGHSLVDVTFQPDVPLAPFEAAGDLVPLIDLESLVTAPADLDAGTWGIALLKVQADLPEQDPNSFMTFAAFGAMELGIVSRSDFVLETQPGAVCDDAPNGLLIQSPTGERAHVTVNGVDLGFASTGYLIAERDVSLVVWGLDGAITVTSQDESVTVLPGQVTTVPLEDLAAAGPPTDLAVYTQYQDLPFDLLPTLPSVGIPCEVAASSNVNIRSGPGPGYAVVDQLAAGESAEVDGQAAGSDGYDWWRLDEGRWVRADVVTANDRCGTVSVVDIPPLPTAEPAVSSGHNQSGPPGSMRHLQMNACTTDGNIPLYAGQLVYMSFGCCGGSSVEDNDQLVSGNGLPYFILDGVALTPDVPSHYMQGGFYSSASGYYWTATVGSHTAAAGFGRAGNQCSFEVLP